METLSAANRSRGYQARIDRAASSSSLSRYTLGGPGGLFPLRCSDLASQVSPEHLRRERIDVPLWGRYIQHGFSPVRVRQFLQGSNCSSTAFRHVPDILHHTVRDVAECFVLLLAAVV